MQKGDKCRFSVHSPADYLVSRDGQIVEIIEDPNEWPTNKSPLIRVKFPDGYVDAAFKTELRPL